MLKIIILTAVLLFIALLAFSIRILIDKNARFRGSSCASASPELEKKGISCGCGGQCETGSNSL